MNSPVLQRTEIVGIMVASFMLVTSLTGIVLLLIEPEMAESFLLWEAIILIIALLSLRLARMVLAKVAANRGSFRTVD